jgi:hypothetical protein
MTVRKTLPRALLVGLTLTTGLMFASPAALAETPKAHKCVVVLGKKLCITK